MTYPDAEAVPPLDAERVRRIRRLGLRVNRLLDSGLAGVYRSAFRGRGIEAESVREYVPGDDAARLDWLVTARLGRPFVREFIEERNLTCLLAVDLSASMRCPGLARAPREVAADVVAVLALAAAHNRDRVGMLLFGSEAHLWVPPAAGRRHALRLVRGVLGHPASSRTTSLNVAVESVLHLCHDRGLLVLISDMDAPDVEPALCRAARQHDVLVCRLSDPLDRRLPEGPVPILLEDAETGRRVEWLGTREQRDAARVWRDEMDRNLRRALARSGADLVELPCRDDPVDALARFLHRRASRRVGRHGSATFPG
ncbi:MAG: DUF58 domain-containing protein [Lentisphaeria bacterium]|nr:DUF58 domain-containing protein [Lentisphaeria bacterium]